METLHMRHVILYAKGWYHHSNDTVEDLKRYCKMDNPSKSFNTKDDVYTEMLFNFSKFVDSVPELANRPGAFDEKVAWDPDPIVAHIEAMLTKLSIYVPMFAEYTGTPIYDKNTSKIYGAPSFKPRRTCSMYKGMSFAECERIASKYLNTSREQRLDEQANKILDTYDFNRAAELINTYNNSNCVDATVLDDEFWDAYSETVNKHLHDDGSVDEFYDIVFTDHLRLEIANQATTIEVELEICYDSVEADDDESLVKTLKEKTPAFTEAFARVAAIRNTLPSTFKESPCGVASMAEDLCKDCIRHKTNGMMCGGVSVTHKNGKTYAYLIDLYDIACYENRLF